MTEAQHKRASELLKLINENEVSTPQFDELVKLSKINMVKDLEFKTRAKIYTLAIDNPAFQKAVKKFCMEIKKIGAKQLAELKAEYESL